MEFWNHIYEHFDPVAVDIGVPIHWYGLMYVLALLSALWFAKWIIKKDKMDIEESVIDDYFIWIEVGVIIGARVWFILFYATDTLYYLTHPWQIFNPFVNGEFVGIRGMSYHGAIVGAIIGSYLYHRKTKQNLWKIFDVVALSVPVGYVFGRIGNFLNQELVGRATDVPWGIYVDGILRHPSQIYEAILEGVVVALILYMVRNKKPFDGSLIILYGILYTIARFVAEFYREPDEQLGFIFAWLTMGQLQSLGMFTLCIVGYYFIRSKSSLKSR
ncbi:MAG: prolipoprotein diacylglyceryl transferase [Epsilonproteobacteria bacterium]|nr:prolipoprotein diacylglyceryl transferase [Campylobacterota bacterium]MBD3839093.1 prolipoprotein diacylglyceryl transferase [Campylobacterota bacterium]